MLKKSVTLLTILAAVVVMASVSHGAIIVDGPVARNKLKQDVKELFYNEKFDELEKLAKKLKTTKAKFPEGHWKLFYFYEGLSNPKGTSEEQWKRWFEGMEKWQRLYPESVTARVAAGLTWLEYGWAARGGYYANTVPDRAWKVLADSADKAFILVNKAPTNPVEDCPERYLLLLQIGKTKGWDRETFFSTLNRAIKFEPRYFWYYITAMDYLLPRWYGQEGEWISFVDKVDSLAGRAGDREFYTRLLVGGSWQRDWQTFDDSNVSWTKIKKGFHDMERDYPNSQYNLNNFARFACLAGDKDAARTAFAKIGNAPYFIIWQDGKSDFDKCRTWAVGDTMKSRLSMKEIYQSGNYQEAIQQRQLAKDENAPAQH